MSEWINIHNQLPEKDGRYLIYELKPSHMHNCLVFNYPYPCCEPNIAFFQLFHLRWSYHSNSNQPCNPTHWMPLPEPPQSEG